MSPVEVLELDSRCETEKPGGVSVASQLATRFPFVKFRLTLLNKL
jgi:hypothetical protein